MQAPNLGGVEEAAPYGIAIAEISETRASLREMLYVLVPTISQVGSLHITASFAGFNDYFLLKREEAFHVDDQRGVAVVFFPYLAPITHGRIAVLGRAA